MLKKAAKISGLTILGLFVLFVLFILFRLSQSQVVLTQGGVYQSIRIPLNDKRSIRWNATNRLQAENYNLADTQGPIILRKHDHYQLSAFLWK